jgi:galactonate dehydratase
MASSQLPAERDVVSRQFPAQSSLPKIKSIEYFRVKPRWIFVKICDDHGGYGWGEATLEGHTKAVEGTLDEMITRLIGYVAE